LERALTREGIRRGGHDVYEGFTTAVLAEIPHDKETVRLANRGHPDPMLRLPDGAIRTLTPPEAALPLGMGDVGIWPDRVDETEFPAGATVLFYTDGLAEARD